MSAQAVPTAALARIQSGVRPLRIGFLGATEWLESSSSPVATDALSPKHAPVDAVSELEQALAVVNDFRPDVTVIFDPSAIPVEALGQLAGVTLGVLVGDLPEGDAALVIGVLDRVVCFRPALSGAQIGGGSIWRSIPPPVSDALFGDVRPLHGRPRAMTIGRSTPHRERMLTPSKHHHDLLQVIHGVTGDSLLELLSEYDVGVYVAPDPGGGFGPQVGMHLAAGQLLLAETLAPAHGLERNIDYMHFDSPSELVWVLDRLGRFPEMYQRIRIRGRLKTEQYRASRVFRRLAFDLLADVAAFGGAAREGAR